MARGTLESSTRGVKPPLTHMGEASVPVLYNAIPVAMHAVLQYAPGTAA